MAKKTKYWDRVMAVAEFLEVPYETRRKWKLRGRVPDKWRIKLFNAAEKAGHKITLNELDQ